MPSSDQAMLYRDKSVESSCVTRLSVSFRYNCCIEALRTYLQQSTPHSLLETSVTGRVYFQQISTCRATKILKTLSISSCPDFILKERIGTIQPHRIVHDEKAYFCLLLARSTAVKEPGLSHRGRPSTRKRKKGNGGYSVEPVPLKDAAWAFVVFPSWPATKMRSAKKSTPLLCLAPHTQTFTYTLWTTGRCVCAHREQKTGTIKQSRENTSTSSGEEDHKQSTGSICVVCCHRGSVSLKAVKWHILVPGWPIGLCFPCWRGN